MGFNERGAITLRKRCFALAATQCTPENPCVAMQLLTQKSIVQDERIDKMEALIDSLRNRLPLWATMGFTGAGVLIGILTGFLLKG